MSYVKFSQLVRSLSTTSPRFQIVQPPVKMFGVAGRYATALYSAASKKKLLETVELELKAFEKTLKEDKKFADFIENRTIQRKLKVEAIKSIAAKTNMSEPTSNFLQLLAENGRLKLLTIVIKKFKIIMIAHRGEVICQVTVAKPLDEKQKLEIEGVLKTVAKEGTSVTLNVKIDPSILGGMIIEIGDLYADLSTATKLKTYTELMSIQT